jgi:glycosyltransferase involved in cell wall biosynthesis
LQSASTVPVSIKTIPFASENHWLATGPSPRKPIFLYVGNITMRKGVHRLLITWKNLKAYRTHELRLVGDMRLSSNFLKDFQGMFTHIPRLRREDLLQHYREASVFVFNAVADGFGYVIVEALASATPVIASRNCGAPDLIEHKSEGLLVDYGVEKQLNSAIEWALSNPKELARMGERALLKAERWRWCNYAAEFISWLKRRVLNQTFV